MYRFWHKRKLFDIFLNSLQLMFVVCVKDISCNANNHALSLIDELILLVWSAKTLKKSIARSNVIHETTYHRIRCSQELKNFELSRAQRQRRA